MKGIIVVDIPETCLDCGFCREIDEGMEACCTLTDDEEFDNCFKMVDDYCQDKPDWCPIKPVPDKVSEIDELMFVPSRYAEGYMDGWNDCIDKILKGKEMSDDRWIPVDPENIPDTEVLCCDEYGEELIGYLSNTAEGWVCESDECIMYYVVAWMPKPEPEPYRKGGE